MRGVKSAEFRSIPTVLTQYNINPGLDLRVILPRCDQRAVFQRQTALDHTYVPPKCPGPESFRSAMRMAQFFTQPARPPRRRNLRRPKNSMRLTDWSEVEWKKRLVLAQCLGSKTETWDRNWILESTSLRR